MAVGTPGTPAVLIPTADTSATATNTAFAKCYFDSGTCDEAGQFDAGSIVLDDGSALPAWITFDDSTQVLTIDPTYTEMGTTTLKVTYTTTFGEDPTYTALVITVECTVTGFTKPADPSDLAYTVWNTQESFSIADQIYTQSPECGYTYTGVYTYTGTNTNIVATSDS